MTLEESALKELHAAGHECTDRPVTALFDQVKKEKRMKWERLPDEFDATILATIVEVYRTKQPPQKAPATVQVFNLLGFAARQAGFGDTPMVGASELSFEGSDPSPEEAQKAFAALEQTHQAGMVGAAMIPWKTILSVLLKVLPIFLS